MRPGRRWMWLLGLAGMAVVVPWISLRDLPVPAQARSFPVLFTQTNGVWESPPMQMTATVAGLSWQEQPPEQVWVRSSEDGVDWTEWVELEVVPDTRPDPGTSEARNQRAASAPAYVGRARFLQYRVRGPTLTSPMGLRAEVVETAGRGLGLLERAELLWRRVELGGAGEADAAPAQPEMVSREQWGGPECLGGATEHPVHYVKRVRVMFVHHTATTNSYGADEGRDVVRGICEYHVRMLGWNDIAYNFLIDRYGTIYEGRGGGADRGVQGAHTGGFNSYSTGVAFIGDHRTIAATEAAQQALVRLATWKLDVHHVDPRSSVKLVSKGSSRYPEGTEVTFRGLAGHRDASATTCPGDYLYSVLPGFREQVHAAGGPKIYGGWPQPDPIRGSPEEGYRAATFSLRFTAPDTAWTLQVRDRHGQVVQETSGRGDADVRWDGTSAGRRLPMGFYQVWVDGTSPQGTPRPVRDTFQLGGFLPPFVDDNGSVHEHDIIDIYRAGITLGCTSDGISYCPDDPVSRWQMAVFLVRALELKPGGRNAFSDDDGHQFEPYINALAAAKVTEGCGGRRFCPEGSVTRAEMAAFLLRAIEHGGHLLPHRGYFPDIPRGRWYTGYVEHLFEHQITQGYDDGTYRPDLSLNRAQMASFLARTFLAGAQ
ncbi:MAG: S-layer homology domain-containing protein [Actinomycetota bacterium]|nr:S-layer homology domain-containing protein [Actinomycetota bacterium]